MNCPRCGARGVPAGYRMCRACTFSAEVAWEGVNPEVRAKTEREFNEHMAAAGLADAVAAMRASCDARYEAECGVSRAEHEARVSARDPQQEDKGSR